MANYLMFGNYSPEALKAVSKKRTDDAVAIITQFGGEFKAGYALLSDIDLVVVVNFPDTEHAMQASAALTKQLGISFHTAAAISIEQFDKLMTT
jgi:uncharacterized protein with GYD domain